MFIRIVYANYLIWESQIDTDRLYCLSDAAGDTLCPGQQVSYSCSLLTAHIWTGSAFTGMCPQATPIADSITLVAADRTVGDVLECGIFNATVTNITPAQAGLRNIDSNVTFTPTTNMPTNRSVVICQDPNQMELERHTINIQGEKRCQVMDLICKLCWSPLSESLPSELRLRYLGSLCIPLMHNASAIGCGDNIRGGQGSLIPRPCGRRETSLVPRPHAKNRESGLVSLAKIPLCAESAYYATHPNKSHFTS